MPTKDDTTERLADAHFALDVGITRIFRVLAPGESNEDPLPVKLLEISAETPEVGISPVGMTAHPAGGIHHASIVIEVSPKEFERLQRAELALPHRWQFADEVRHHATTEKPTTRRA